ncbi:MAG: phage tail sheath C-terminal domain-containing protein [Nitrososphaeraceae archaeon]
MSNLISPGVSVQVTDESFFIPATARTVPLIFIATSDMKMRPDGLTPAAGTYESNVIRTVTSLKQSTELYGVPRFLEDSSGNPLHGDCRNEYGLFALNQFLGIGSLAYVVRANVNLNDNLTDIRTMWDSKMDDAAFMLESLVSTYLSEYNQTNGYTQSDPEYKTTVNSATFLSLAATATLPIWQMFSYSNSQESFTDNHTVTPYVVYANGYAAASTGTYLGLTGIAAEWVADTLGGTVPTEWTAVEASSTLLGASDSFKFTAEFLNETRLGANDAARRLAITTALQASITSNTDIRSETYEYNLILCPGYHEVVDEMITLSVDIKEEAFVVADPPFDKSPEDVVTWAATVNRRTNVNVAYYYPHGIASNLDGKNVFVAASGTVLRTLAYSDEVSEVWFAPAGLRRGIVTTLSEVGYVSGTLGTPTTFNSIALNNGQRDNLYKYNTNINPIVFLPGQGIIVFGQKTSAPAASALDRINVVRLVQYIRRSLRKNTLSFIFEPNDALTRDNLKATVDAFLGDLIVKRGLYDYASVCDTSNNTPDRIDRNEMYVDIAIKPVKSAEFLYIPIRVVSTGASLTS